jgi:hypothetical protein
MAQAYDTHFVGNSATNFIDHLNKLDDEVLASYYAKAISVVQSSGSGKSRMMTEVR